jgi:hypothetical protein
MDHNPPTYDSSAAGIIGVCIMPDLFSKMRVLITFLPGVARNHDCPNCSLLNNWDYRCEPSTPAWDVSFLT